ncbi:MAG: hypothetical protein R3C70_10830 [Geminicoccaceae bacterium]|nr:hypothetical protein [Geminicoccaceae bacterium]
MSSDQAIIETRSFGRIIRVTAIDPQTLVEVTFQVPHTCARFEIERLAQAKLDYVRRKGGTGGQSPVPVGRKTTS